MLRPVGPAGDLQGDVSPGTAVAFAAAMGHPEIPAFESAIQKTFQWLEAIMRELDADDRHLAYSALRETLRALRDLMPPREVVHLGAQLPLLIRGMYYDGWTITEAPRTQRSRKAFLERVASASALPAHLRTEHYAETIARAVLRVLAGHLSPGEAHIVKHALPEDAQMLWPA